MFNPFQMRARALELLWTSRLIDAEEARQLGLVRRVLQTGRCSCAAARHFFLGCLWVGHVDSLESGVEGGKNRPQA